jgi:hypothetical protein
VAYPTGTVVLSTLNKIVTLRVHAVPLPVNITSLIESHALDVRQVVDYQARVKEGHQVQSGSNVKKQFVEKIKWAIEKAKKEGWLVERDIWSNITEEQ